MRFTIRFFLSVLLLASPAFASYTFSSVTGCNPIPDNDPGGCTITITIPDVDFILGAGNNVTVSIAGLSHGFSGDLIATLSFNSIDRDLFRQVTDPKRREFRRQLRFQQWFSRGDLWAIVPTLGDADTIPNGGYFPTTTAGAVSDFTVYNGMLITGVWSLNIADLSPGDEGSYIQWSLTLDTINSSVPEPGTLGLGALGLLGFATATLLRRKVTRS